MKTLPIRVQIVMDTVVLIPSTGDGRTQTQRPNWRRALHFYANTMHMWVMFRSLKRRVGDDCDKGRQAVLENLLFWRKRESVRMSRGAHWMQREAQASFPY